MTERPIVLDRREVLAVLDGHMTEVWRPVKTREPLQFIGSACDGDQNDPACWGWAAEDEYMVLARGLHSNGQAHRCTSIQCPLGEAGHRLWVRETWAQEDCGDDDGYRLIWKADRCARWLDSEDKEPFYLEHTYKPGQWSSSTTMPRWASRITLEITSVRVARVQDITPEQAIRTGIRVAAPSGRVIDEKPRYFGRGALWTDPRDAFADIWRHKCHSWDGNPWCWVLGIKVLPS